MYQELTIPKINSRCELSNTLNAIIEGFIYITFIALVWSNEEPSKLNTLFAAWSSYAIVAFVLVAATKSGTIKNPTSWARMFFIQNLLLLIVCNFVWLKGSVSRANGDFFDPVRFDYYAVLLAESGLNPAKVYLQNYTGTIWYAGIIYRIFGVSKFYVVLFNGALSFSTWVMLVSTMKHLDGNPERWQWLRFGMLMPDFLIHFTNVSKEPLCVFIVMLGIWLITKNFHRKQLYVLAILVPVLMLGLAVRAASSVLIVLVAFIWFWKDSSRNRKIAILIACAFILIFSQPLTDFISQTTGASRMNWKSSITNLTNPNLRIREDLSYSQDSWNTIFESMPIYLMPIVAPVKGFFMMIAPMPLWKIHIYEILSGIRYSDYGSQAIKDVFPKITGWLFVFSIPFLIAALFDVFYTNRILWIRISLTFVLLLSLMGFSIYGMIEPRYRPMILPFWLSTCGIGYYYGKPKKYISITIIIAILGAVVYIIPKF